MTEDSIVLRPEPVVGCYVQFQTGLEHNQTGMEFHFETWKRERTLFQQEKLLRNGYELLEF